MEYSLHPHPNCWKEDVGRHQSSIMLKDSAKPNPHKGSDLAEGTKLRQIIICVESV